MTADPVGMAKFEVLAEKIREDIRQGELKVGDKLPPHRALVAKYGVALGTVQRALLLLEDEKWVLSRPTVGVFVLEPPDSGGEGRDVPNVEVELEAIRQRLDALERRVMADD